MSENLKKETVSSLFVLAPSSYTASAARQIIDTAAWLLQEHRSEAEVVKYLGSIIDEVLPPYLPELIKNSKALQKCMRRGNNEKSDNS